MNVSELESLEQRYRTARAELDSLNSAIVEADAAHSKALAQALIDGTPEPDGKQLADMKLRVAQLMRALPAVEQRVAAARTEASQDYHKRLSSAENQTNVAMTTGIESDGVKALAEALKVLQRYIGFSKAVDWLVAAPNPVWTKARDLVPESERISHAASLMGVLGHVRDLRGTMLEYSAKSDPRMLSKLHEIEAYLEAIK